MSSKRSKTRRQIPFRLWLALAATTVVTLTPVPAQVALSVDGLVASATGGFQFPDGTIQTTAVGPLLAAVPKTGQLQCFDLDGNAVPCSDTGQDGELQAGVEPPTPRFTANGDGTVTDNLTGLVWLQDANCFGARTWAAALADANALEAGFCGLLDGSQVGDWRLPNPRESVTLIDYGRAAPALPQAHPFVDVQDKYWTSTTSLSAVHMAWEMNIELGIVVAASKTFETFFVWPVRGGL